MKKIESIHFTYAELFQNVFKRLLLLAGKLAGYKGFAVLIATVLLRLGYIRGCGLGFCCDFCSLRGGSAKSFGKLCRYGFIYGCRR